MAEKRPYTLKKRAESQEETRRRIAAATAELHATVGPARTTISAVAERAGVQRLTVYRHFPEEADLFAACNAHFVAENPPPDLGAILAHDDPDERAQRTLAAMYGWYEANEGMLANVERDAPLLPALAAIADPGETLAQLREALMRGRTPDERTRALLGHALQFSTWRSLVRGQGLTSEEAAALLADLARQ
jgi:AcrR family transcriptional regulator